MTFVRAIGFVGIIHGLGWAVRGHFGHEWGAAWAGALGSMAVIAAAGRKDWARKLPMLAVLGALGWATGGMMSYGRIVGFGRGTDFGNVLYGLAMIAVVGSLHGFIGGGIFALGLETSKDRPTDWSALVTQMTVGGFLFWGLLIYQLEWKMTPPRSELWAGCLGASAALAWYMQRHGCRRALSVAGWSALGAGFGFAIGNFLQTLGTASGLKFNWWNVMEFTLGFCAGLGMARGVLAQDWPDEVQASTAGNRAALAILVAAIPVTNLITTFQPSQLAQEAQRAALPDPGAYALRTTLLAVTSIIVFAAVISWVWARNAGARAMVFLMTAYYVVFSHVRKGILAGISYLQLEQYLYWVAVVLAALLIGASRSDKGSPFRSIAADSARIWAFRVATLLALIAIIAAISISVHGELPGAQRRF